MPALASPPPAAASSSCNVDGSGAHPAASPPPSVLLNPALLAELADAVEGRLTITPAPRQPTATTPSNPASSTHWNALLKSPTPVLQPGVPAAVLHCASKADVVRGVRWAARHGVKVSAKGTGHQYGGMSLVHGGLVLDLCGLTQLAVNPATKTAVVGPGITTRALREATALHGLHFPGGHISDVGIAGFILGGGHGWGVTKWGAGADNVLAFEVVVLPGASSPLSAAAAAAGDRDTGGDGSEAGHDALALRTVTAESDPELFAGLRGAGAVGHEGSGAQADVRIQPSRDGGWCFTTTSQATTTLHAHTGAFLAIVTEFQVRLHAVEAMLPTITATFPAAAAAEVGTVYAALLRSAPPCVEVSMSLVRSQGAVDGPEAATAAAETLIIIGATAFKDDDDAAAAAAAFDAIRALLPSRRVSLHDERLPYLQALSILDDAWDWPGLCLYGHGMFVRHAALTRELMTAVAAAADAMTSPRSLILFAPAAPPSPTPSALDFRGDVVFLAAYAMWPRTPGGPAADGDTDHAAWVRHVAGVVDAAGLYVNEIMHNAPGQARACFTPATLQLLTRVKARTDPTGLLRPLPVPL